MKKESPSTRTTVREEEDETESAKDGELGFNRPRVGDDEDHRGGRGHPPKRDLRAGEAGELQILVGGELGDQSGEEGDHPKLPEEDDGKDKGDQDDGSKDAFHCAVTG